MPEAPERQLIDFQYRNIRILTHLLSKNAISDDVVDDLRCAELEYFSLLEKYRLLEMKVNIDEKTHLLKFNKDYLTNIVKTASRVYYSMNERNYPVSLVRFDIDDFSKINNLYGHETGDHVLAGVAALIREHSRPTDYAIRFGGEEFDVILPATDGEGAEFYVNKILRNIELADFHSADAVFHVTVSAGISTLNYTFQDNPVIRDTEVEAHYSRLQKEADDALYEAKCRGKNRLVRYDPEHTDAYDEYRQTYAKICRHGGNGTHPGDA